MKVGVYVDVANIAYNGGFGMRYEVLREFAMRNNAEIVRLNAYAIYDSMRAKNDEEYRRKQLGFHAALNDIGFKVIIKETRWFTDEQGNRQAKANVDLDMAVDILLQSEALDRIIMVTGDGDFVKVVQTLQSKGCRVEVLAFDNVSTILRSECDQYVSGYLVPGLLPIIRESTLMKWGGMGGCARGALFMFDANRGYGLFRYLTKLDAQLWRTDSRDPQSPFQTVFVHETQLPANVDTSILPNKNILFEFKIVEGTELDKPQAKDVLAILAKI
jgi:uncharacterized LabA/DUF88 family protein